MAGSGRRCGPAGDRGGPENEARALYLIGKAQLALGRGDLALDDDERCLAQCRQAGLADFDLAYAYELRARSLWALGRADEARHEWAAARAVPIADPEDRAVVEADFAGGLEATR